jgi:hypothetical protein
MDQMKCEKMENMGDPAAVCLNQTSRPISKNLIEKNMENNVAICHFLNWLF